MPYETDLDTAFTILLGKAQGTIIGAPVEPVEPLPAATTRVVNIAFDLGVDGAIVPVGRHLTFRLGLNGPARVVSWSLVGFVNGAPTAGSIVVDVRTASAIASLASICGGDEPELVAQTEAIEEPVTDNWSAVISDSSWIQARVTNSGGTLHRASLTLRVVVE